MDKFQLNNGASVVYAGNAGEYSVCLSVSSGWLICLKECFSFRSKVSFPFSAGQ